MATLFDDASLVMIPSGYKDDKLYSIKPTSGDGDFTFSRDGSGASPATRVNSAGLIEKGRTNLSLYSNTFSSWTAQSDGSVTSGQSGYDGTNNAWLLTSGASTYSRIERTITHTGVYTISVYAKAGTLGWLSFENSGISSDETYFDLVNGTTGTSGSNVIDSNIESIGNGWWRCSATLNGTSNVQRIYPAVGNGDLNSAQGNIYIQNFQFEKGLVSTSVIETTTAAASAGILGDMPRLDYSGGATCPSLLLEPARTNLITHSELLTDSSWTNQLGGTIDVGQASSVSGYNDAWKLNKASGTFKSLRLQKTLASDNYTLTWFLKEGTISVAEFRFDGGLGAQFIDFDLSSGTHGTNANLSNIEMVAFNDGWYRCSASINTNLTNVHLYVDDASVSSGAGYILAQYPQLEAGSYPTSYVPSYGSATARGEDVCINAGDSSTFNTSEGVLFGELKAFDSLISTNRKIVLGDGSYNNGIEFGFQTTTNQMQFIIRSAGSISMNVTTTAYDVTDYVKFAISYKNNQGKVFINGSQLGSTDTSVTTPATISRLDLRFSTASEFEGNVKQLLVFNTALTDAELAALTTL